MLLADFKTQDAVIRRMEIMGEASAYVSGLQERIADAAWKDMTRCETSSFARIVTSITRESGRRSSTGYPASVWQLPSSYRPKRTMNSLPRPARTSRLGAALVFSVTIAHAPGNS